MVLVTPSGKSTNPKFCIPRSPSPYNLDLRKTSSSGTASNCGRAVIALPYESDPDGWLGLYND